MNLVFSAPAASFTPLAHTNLHAALSTSSLSSLASSYSLASTASTPASAASSPALLTRNFSLEQIVAAAQLQNHLYATQLARKSDAHSMLPSTTSSSSPAASLSHSSSASSPPSSSVSVASSPSSPAGGSSSSSSAPTGSEVHKRIRASKNKQKHNESESRRRDRLRTQFNALRNASECDKKDRIAILAAATDRLRQQDARVRQYETERELLIQQLNQTNVQLNRAQLAAATSAAGAQGVGLLSLLGKEGNAGDVGKLAAGQVGWLASLPCAFVGLDGKFLDVNAAFVALTGHPVDFILSATIFVLTPQHELTPTFLQLKRLLAGEIDSWESDRSCLAADGQALPVHMTMTVAKSRDGKPEFFALFFVSKAESNSGVSALSAGQQQQQQQAALQLPQPTGLRPPASGSMGLFSQPITSNISLLASQQQASLQGHPHVSPLSQQHLGAAGLGLAALQHTLSQQSAQSAQQSAQSAQQQQQQQHQQQQHQQQQQQQQQQHRFESFQPQYSLQQHM